ncbi:MAG: hypothetical protein V2A77_07540 [Pseudomonadota bacterium]
MRWPAGAGSTPWRLFAIQVLAVLFLLEGAHFLAARGIEPLSSWFYVVAWYSFIFLTDTCIHALKNESLLRTRPGEFLLMLPWSVFIWLIFELVNVRLANWHYINVTTGRCLRWAGYFVSFATVLPGILLSAELMQSVGLFRTSRTRPFPRTSAWYPCFWVVGALCALLPLAWPRYFFPLIWGAFVFLLEPFNHRRGAPSLMTALERGDPRPVYLLLSAGAVCGGLWEFWNFWAKTKWVYSVPFFTDLKLFEMPLAGFLGFPPFALECYVMYNFVRWVVQRRQDGPESRGRNLVRIMAAAVVLAVTCVVGFSAIDAATVWTWAGCKTSRP